MKTSRVWEKNSEITSKYWITEKIKRNLSMQWIHIAPSKTGDIFDSTFTVLGRVIRSYQLNGTEKDTESIKNYKEMKWGSKRCRIQGGNAFQTHFSGGKSVEYNSTFVSASKSARIPRAQILLSQNLHSSLTTVLVWNAGCILRDILSGKPPLSLSLQRKTFPTQRRHKMAVLWTTSSSYWQIPVFWLVVAWWRSRLTWPLNFLNADWTRRDNLDVTKLL